jgi:hypothetical protein
MKRAVQIVPAKAAAAAAAKPCALEGSTSAVCSCKRAFHLAPAAAGKNNISTFFFKIAYNSTFIGQSEQARNPDTCSFAVRDVFRR